MKQTLFDPSKKEPGIAMIAGRDSDVHHVIRPDRVCSIIWPWLFNPVEIKLHSIKPIILLNSPIYSTQQHARDDDVSRVFNHNYS